MFMLMGCFGDRDYPTASVTTLFFFLRRKKNSKRKSCKGDAPLTPAVGRDTTTAWGISGRMGYRPHNADRSECTF